MSLPRAMPAVVFALFLLAPAFDMVAAAERPNIVILLADDLGWADVSYHDRRARTPHLDRLASESVELDRFTVAPMCSPTRAALLTGRYPIRFGLARAVIPPHRDYGLPSSEETLAELLSGAGYAQRAVFGKWHLGHRRAKWHPLRNGFTHFYGHYNGAIDYFTHVRDGERDWHRDWEPVADQGYSTELIAGAAADWIRAQAAADDPYFCYVAFNAPHSPFQAKAADLARFDHLPGNPKQVDESASRRGRLSVATRRLALAAMIWSLDEGVGRILDAIDETGESENTIVWFFSDNGGIGAIPNNNAPLRGDKLDVFEGGVRVPACVRWPARWAPRKLAEPANVVDVLPTLLAAAGLDWQPDPGRPLDGVDLGPLLSGKRTSAEPRDLYFYHGQAGPENEKIAITTPDWKLVVLGPDLSRTRGTTAKHEVLLFRFPDDLLERQNVASEHPQVVADLTRKLIEFRQLQPPDGVPPYGQGRGGFSPPDDWRLTPDSP